MKPDVAVKTNVTKPVVSRELFQLLEEDVHLYQNLLTLLGKERECLRALSVDDLLGVTKAKETELLKIRMLEQTLKDLTGEILKRHDRSVDEVTLTALTGVVDGRQARLLKHYLAILAALKEEIAEYNTYNKRFIQEGLEHVEESIAILTSHIGSSSYTPQGGSRRETCRARVLSREA